MTLKIYVRDGKTVEEYIQEEVQKGIEQYLSNHGDLVALPERKDPTQQWHIVGGVAKAAGWNACLDEIKALSKENEALACNLQGKHALTGATYTHLVQERDTLREEVEKLKLKVGQAFWDKQDKDDEIKALIKDKEVLRKVLSAELHRYNQASDTINYQTTRIEKLEALLKERDALLRGSVSSILLDAASNPNSIRRRELARLAESIEATLSDSAEDCTDE